MTQSNEINYSFTFQEIRILIYIQEGLTSQQLADKLMVSIFTIKTHRKNIIKKAKVKGKAAFMQFVYTFTPPRIL
jgi:DNA-binding CsgD family transcriptional regulator